MITRIYDTDGLIASIEHTAYSQAEDGSVAFSLTEFTGMSYIGYYTDTSEIESVEPSNYEWEEYEYDTEEDDYGTETEIGDSSEEVSDTEQIETDIDTLTAYVELLESKIEQLEADLQAVEEVAIASGETATSYITEDDDGSVTVSSATDSTASITITSSGASTTYANLEGYLWGNYFVAMDTDGILKMWWIDTTEDTDDSEDTE